MVVRGASNCWLGCRYIALGKYTKLSLRFSNNKQAHERHILIHLRYPFHLRPKQRQASQYIRMAADIVHDLELDQAPDDFDHVGFETDESFLAGIRAYIACYYLCSGISSIWAKKSSLPFEQWTATCCDILERSTAGQDATADQSLAWLARLGNIIEETLSLTKRKGQVQHEAQHVLLMAKGMEAQLQEWKGRMPADISSRRKSESKSRVNYADKLTSNLDVVHMGTLFTEMCLKGYTLLKFPYYNPRKQTQPTPDSLVEPSQLWCCTKILRTWYDYLSSLPDSEFANFAAIDWGHFVAMIILGLRLSFPLPKECPSWDHTAAREVVGLGSFLERFTHDGNDTVSLTPASSKSNSSTDVLSASKVVLGVVKRKYEKRLDALEKAAVAQPPHPMPIDADAGLRKCPMFDGSLDPFIETWDDTFLDPSSLANASLMDPGLGFVPEAGSSDNTQPVVYHDLWATMTMGWSQDNFGNMDFSGV